MVIVDVETPFKSPNRHARIGTDVGGAPVGR